MTIQMSPGIAEVYVVEFSSRGKEGGAEEVRRPTLGRSYRSRHSTVVSW